MFRRLFVGVAMFSCVGLLAASQAISNWQAPSSWTPPRALGMRPLGVEADISGPLPFVPITPCRQYDSRNATPLADNTSRTISLINAPCGIPAAAKAVSVNITIFNIIGAPSNGVFRVGIVSPPPTAWINFPPTETQRANAGVVSLDASGQIVVQVNMGAGQVDFTCDVNGYYSSTFANPSTTFTVSVNNPNSPAMSAINTSTSCFSRCGVSADILSTSSLGAFALAGFAGGLTGPGLGVYGQTSSESAGAAGVYGAATFVVSLGSYLRSGVRGESSNGYGVLGVSRSYGVGAALVDSGGSQLAYALLAAAGTPNYAVFAGGDFGGIGAKYFVEPHPEDAAKVIRYVSLEGPESGTYFRGRGTFVHGKARITVPESFRMVSDEEGLTVQITPIGEPAAVAVMRISLDGIEARATGDVEFFYLVHGVRRAFKNHEPIAEGTEFRPSGPNEMMPAYLTEEARKRLIANGTYNADGTVNLQTAERVGWTKAWFEREAKTRQEAEDARKAAAKEIR